MIYKVTYEKIEVLRYKKDYKIIGNKIIFSDLKEIRTDYLGDLLLNSKEGFVIFSKNYKNALRDKEKINNIICGGYKIQK